MKYKNLKDDGKIQAFNASRDEVSNLLQLAERDLLTAEKVLELNIDWAFSITYNATLQVSKAYMFYIGYRPSSFESHKTVFEFINIALGDQLGETISFIDRKRKKRHKAVYDQVGIVSIKEAKAFLVIAKKYVNEIKKLLGSTT